MSKTITLDKPNTIEADHKRRRSFGEHLTSIDIFNKFILPQIKNSIHDYCWVDLYCGEGNLILPILNEIQPSERIKFFKNHIYLFDIQEAMIKRCIENATKYGIPEDIAKRNIRAQDTLKEYPDFIKKTPLPIFHITNPPYLYIGYIVKHATTETRKSLAYFEDENKGLQDLYQIALMNDLRYSIRNMIYIIPSNFLFGFSVSNQFRDNFLPSYNIKTAFIFEKKIFDFTGTNVCICHFERKPEPDKKPIIFNAIKFNNKVHHRSYVLKPENHYKAGDGFNEFVKKYKCVKPLEIEFYLTKEGVNKEIGSRKVEVIDANDYMGNSYRKITISVNEDLYKKIINNPLFVRTVDTGSITGRVGLFPIKEVYGTDGALVTKAKYRTHPIQVFFTPTLNKKDTELLKSYFNFIIEYFREATDSEFMTTYKYSESSYIRKYLGLSQAKKVIETFPILNFVDEKKQYLCNLIKQKDYDGIISLLQQYASKNDLFK